MHGVGSTVPAGGRSQLPPMDHQPPPDSDDMPAPDAHLRAGLRRARFNAQARTHLANERTFLAWLRTGVTFVALGIAAVQLLDPRHVAGLPLHVTIALVFIATGCVLTFVGRWRYRQTAIELERGQFRPHRRGLDLVVAMLVVVGVMATMFVLRSS